MLESGVGPRLPLALPDVVALREREPPPPLMALELPRLLLAFDFCFWPLPLLPVAALRRLVVALDVPVPEPRVPEATSC